MTYDSKEDTLEHIYKVCDYLDYCAKEFYRRGTIHDQSKLESPEKEVFDEVTPKLATLTYGSDEYKASLADMKPALDHHYAHNRHHPEHYGEAGINGMNLFDIIEMLMDWKAASERHANGDIYKSILINRDRFDISDQLYRLLVNTAEDMGW